LDVKITHAEKEEREAWDYLVAAKERGYAGVSHELIDHAQIRHEQAVTGLKELGDYDYPPHFQSMLMEEENKRRLLRARQAQDAALSSHDAQGFIEQDKEKTESLARQAHEDAERGDPLVGYDTYVSNKQPAFQVLGPDFAFAD
jgi:hypothetical protein